MQAWIIRIFSIYPSIPDFYYKNITILLHHLAHSIFTALWFWVVHSFTVSWESHITQDVGEVPSSPAQRLLINAVFRLNNNGVVTESGQPLAEKFPGFDALPGNDESGRQESGHDHRDVLEDKERNSRPVNIRRLPRREAARHLPPARQVWVSADFLLPLDHPVRQVQVLVNVAEDGKCHWQHEQRR